MYIIKIMMEFMHSPIWYCDENGIEFYDNQEEFEPFYRDELLNDTAKKIEKLNNSFYIFNDTDSSFYFDEKKEKENKNQIICLLNIVKDRLKQLNNNGFIIEDYCTDYYNEL